MSLTAYDPHRDYYTLMPAPLDLEAKMASTSIGPPQIRLGLALGDMTSDFSESLEAVPHGAQVTGQSTDSESNSCEYADCLVAQGLA